MPNIRMHVGKKNLSVFFRFFFFLFYFFLICEAEARKVYIIKQAIGVEGV